ncbi:uncharacterized protein LOC134856508 [Symsagittifera roscoffensis]|uniref:uncharacterized protein LOC134856508 n=1 Tax=Symsagittifera roscoffensis TaxID=84072 RepID=UPI00307B494E
MRKEEFNKEQLQEDYDQMKWNLNKAVEVYTTAMESEKSLGMTVGSQMIQGVINAVTAPLNMLNQRNICSSFELKRHKERKLGGIYFWIGVLLERARNAVDDEASSKTVQKELHSLKNLTASFRNICSFQDNGHHDGRVKILKENSEKVLLILEESQNSLNEDNNAKNKQREEVEQLTEELECALKAINAYFSNMSSTMPIENPSPRLDKMMTSCSDAIQPHDQTIKMKLEIAQTGLQAAKDDFTESSKKMIEASGQYCNSIEELGKINLDNVSLVDIRKLLVKNLKALGLVKTEWEKLVRFFQTIANIIKFAIEENVKKFKSHVYKIQRRAIEYTLSDMHRDILYQNANNVNKLAFVVSNLSAMYCDVSENHIINQVASLGQLLALDPDQERKAIQDKQYELKQQAKKACSSIKDIVTKRMTDFEKRVNQRMTAIENQMKVVMPVVEENPRVRAAINEAIAESNQIKADVRKKDKEDYFKHLDADEWC